MIHGTRPTYATGCRCTPCTTANTRYGKRLRLDHERGRTRTVDATGTRRRLRALGVMRYSHATLATELGIDETTVRRWTSNRNPRVRLTTAQAVAALYDRLSMTPGPDNVKVETWARRGGGHPPLAWDDDTIDDPGAVPNTDTDRTRGVLRVDDLEWLIDTGCTREAAATRLGVTTESIDRYLHRAGRRDLIARLTRLDHGTAA